MIVFPAIDLKDQKCVRLYKGAIDAATIYNENPLAQAQSFEKAGFKWLHIIDLNGAVSGRSLNADVVKDIIRACDLQIQLGGGIRNLAGVDRWISAGVDRIILGTAAVKNPELVKESCRLFPGKIAVGIDSRNGKAAISGWTEESDISVIELVKRFEGAGVSAVIHTDIDRDGTGAGVNIESMIALSEATSIPVIASGGVGALNDLQMVKDAGLKGVIIGRAAYDGSLDLSQAANFR